MFNETRNVLNKRFYYEDNYLIIRGVSSSSFLNDSLTIYFNYNFVMEKFKEEKINTYQIDIKDIKEIDSIIKTLKKSNFYKELKEINDNKLSYTLKYSNDLENYYVFYELINIINVIIYFFLALSILISITLLSNIIYSFNEEEKVNLGLFRILGFSKFSVYSLNFYLSLIISFISLVIIIFINNYILLLEFTAAYIAGRTGAGRISGSFLRFGYFPIQEQISACCDLHAARLYVDICLLLLADRLELFF